MITVYENVNNIKVYYFINDKLTQLSRFYNKTYRLLEYIQLVNVSLVGKVCTKYMLTVYENVKNITVYYFINYRLTQLSRLCDATQRNINIDYIVSIKCHFDLN